MIRAGLLSLLVGLCVLSAAPSAGAHPLGNFTINHLTEVSVSRDGVELRYILDRAEIPTFQARRQSREELLAGLAVHCQPLETPRSKVTGALVRSQGARQST